MTTPHYLSTADIGSMTRAAAEKAIQERVQTAFLGEGVTLARVLGGPKMLLRTGDKGFARHIMLDGYWESWLTVFCARTLRPGMTAFDVGANFGYYTLLFANRIGAAGRVVAVEPNPATFDFLSETVALNGYDRMVDLVAGAASARSGGTAELFVPLGEPKNATIAVRGGDRPSELVASVPTVSIDDLAARMDRVDFVKIDVEGAEADVLRGMTATIERHRPTIVLEYNASRYADPAAILDGLIGRYGHVGEVDIEAKARPIERATILGERINEDRLLVFSMQPPDRAPASFLPAVRRSPPPPRARACRPRPSRR